MTEYEKYFKKIYEFKSTTTCTLPNKIFSSTKWFIPELQKKKLELNEIKSLLGKYKLKAWTKHTAHRDPSGLVIKRLSENIQPELLTQAWCKLYEILCQFPVIPEQALGEGELTTLHLCEAPGAFICALNHYLVLNHPNIKWNWVASTLNPNYEGNELSQMIPDDRFIRYTIKNWFFGLDFSGDITKYYNHVELVNTLAEKKVYMITADGSVDCMQDPGEQERHVEFLQFCETLTALSVLETGGTFVLKIFTTFEDTTINLLYLLNCVFEKVTIFKPCTSKSGNSEVYVVNVNYKGLDTLTGIWPQLTAMYGSHKDFSSSSMLSLSELPDCFLQEIHECSDFYMQKQIRAILDNVYCFENKEKSNANTLYVLKSFIAHLYVTMYNLKCIPNDKKIVPYISVGDNWRVHSVHGYSSFTCFSVENLIKSKISRNIIDIRIGKQIEKVQNSKFTHKDNLQKLVRVYDNTHGSSFTLYEHVLKYVGRNNDVINRKQFDLYIYHKFQRDFFYRVYNSISSKSNIIFLNIPFHTHFLAGLLYILLHAFEKVYFGNGIIILYKSHPDSLNNVKDLLSVIDSAYKKIDEINCDSRNENDSFGRDIVQIIPPSYFDETYSSILGKIWNYNNHMFLKNVCL